MYINCFKINRNKLPHIYSRVRVYRYQFRYSLQIQLYPKLHKCQGLVAQDKFLHQISHSPIVTFSHLTVMFNTYFSFFLLNSYTLIHKYAFIAINYLVHMFKILSRTDSSFEQNWLLTKPHFLYCATQTVIFFGFSNTELYIMYYYMVRTQSAIQRRFLIQEQYNLIYMHI